MPSKEERETHLEIERIQLRSQKRRQQKHDRRVVREARRPRPRERGKVVRRELRQHAPRLGSQPARLAEALPGEGLHFEVLAGLHAEVGADPVADEHVEEPLWEEL